MTSPEYLPTDDGRWELAHITSGQDKDDMQEEPLTPYESPQFFDKGSACSFTWPNAGITLNVRQVRDLRDRITCRIDGWVVPNNQKQRIPTTSLNLLYSRARKELAKELTERYRNGFDWYKAIDVLSELTLDWHNKGEPVITISSGQKGNTKTKPEYLIEPIIYKNQVNMMFGAGKVGKSYLSLLFAVMTKLPYTDNELGLRPQSALVLMLDYETDRYTTEHRLDSLCRGMGLPTVQMDYRRCARPLTEDMEAIQAVVAEKNIDFIIVDSVGVAACGDLNDAQTATGLYSAMRRVEATWLLITHTSKGESGSQKTAFGSVYFTNLARNVFEVKKQQGAGEDFIDVGLIHRDNNLGRLQEPLCYRLTFNEALGTVEVTQNDAAEIQAFSGELPLKTRILNSLKALNRAAAVDELAEELETSETQIRARLSELRSKGQVVKIDDRWGLTYKD